VFTNRLRHQPRFLRCLEERVPVDQGTGRGILPGPRAGIVFSPVGRSHVQRSGGRVRADQEKLRRRMATVDRAGGRVVRETILPGQPAGRVRYRTGNGPGDQRVSRQRFPGRGQEGNSVFLPERCVKLVFNTRSVPDTSGRVNEQQERRA